MKLIWNGIVRDEAAIIERCVQSLLPHIDGAVIVDTGSTDTTLDILASKFGEVGKPLWITQAPFENFSQARNAALQAARDSELPWEYLLLCDADMVLKVSDPDWVKQLNGGLSYDMRQTAGSVTYHNRRVVNRRATGTYRCRTHEYLDVDSAGVLEGAEFIDYADGSNRIEKYSRDIALLQEEIRVETNPGLIQRAHFYLAQSYFDSGNWQKAAEHYKLRTTLGGFDEEVWNAQLHYAHCLENLGDKAGFVWEMLQAYRMRPSRAEALYDLAKYFRIRGENAISLLFSEPGMQVPYPKDELLFVNNDVYATGLKEEFAICAYYNPTKRKQGAKVCDELVLQGSEQARSNQYWYLKPLAAFVPSFQPTQLHLSSVLEGFVAMNPSVVNHYGYPLVLVRTVNYTINEWGAYDIRQQNGDHGRTGVISTVNYLVHLAGDLTVEATYRLALPSNWPEPQFDLVRGFEDSRLFQYDGVYWTLSTVRELTPEGWCEQVVAPVTAEGYGGLWSQVLPKERRHEKNWMPWATADKVRFVYRLGTLVDQTGRIVCQHENKFDVGHISGGSQVIKAEGLSLALVHEARFIPGQQLRYYQHRFVTFVDDGRLLRISQPFVFHDKQIEFAAGLAYFPATRQLLASYGVKDREAWLAWMDFDEVLAFIVGES